MNGGVVKSGSIMTDQLKSEIADWTLNGFIASQQVSIANKCKFISTSKRISLQEIFFAKMPNNGQ